MNRFICVLCIALFLPLTGCPGGLKVNYVEGVVKHDGVPLEGATVNFSPKTEGQGMLASGTTDANGVYKLTVLQGGAVGRGTVEGEYMVSVSKKTTDPIRMDPPPPAYAGSANIPIYGYVFPRKYTNSNTSGLTATVKKGKNLNIDFELTGPGDVTLPPEKQK